MKLVHIYQDGLLVYNIQKRSCFPLRMESSIGINEPFGFIMMRLSVCLGSWVDSLLKKKGRLTEFLKFIG